MGPETLAFQPSPSHAPSGIPVSIPARTVWKMFVHALSLHGEAELSLQHWCPERTRVSTNICWYLLHYLRNNLQRLSCTQTDTLSITCSHGFLSSWYFRGYPYSPPLKKADMEEKIITENRLWFLYFRGLKPTFSQQEQFSITIFRVSFWLCR